MTFSILLLTLNEEQNLPKCLDAISWCDDIVVLDSFSTDRTQEIARKAGTGFFQRKFDDFANQRNYGLKELKFKYPWVFHLDADEVFTFGLRDEIIRSIENLKYDCYRVPSKTMFYGKWIKYAGMYPTYQVRLTRTRDFVFKQVGHGQKEDILPSKVGTLKEPYLHYSFAKGIRDWFEKHNRYSCMEAQETIQHLKNGNIDWKGLISKDRYQRRTALKKLSFRMPFRPAMRFFYMYFLRRGILDGVSGLHYCLLLAVYEYMIVLKFKEIQWQRKGHIL